MADMAVLQSSASRVVYKNGLVYTVDVNETPDWSTNPKEAVVTENGKILFVGSSPEAETFVQPDTEVIDLKKAVVLPGIHDVHVHPLEAGCPVWDTVELPPDTNPEKMVATIKRAAQRQKGTKWVLGHGYSLDSMLDHVKKGGRPPKDILDEAVPNAPAIMMEETSHSVWVNSRALALAGIDKDTANMPAGLIMKDKTGEPNGILLENAGNAIIDIAMEPTADLEELYYHGLLRSLKKLSKFGITSVCDARCFWKSNHHKVWERAMVSNELTVRTILGLWAYPHFDDAAQIQSLKSLFKDDPDSMLRISQIKLYSDGLLQSTTAAVLQPYLVNYRFEGLSENKGMNYFTENRIYKYLKELQSFEGSKGFDFHIHTIGDRAVRESLNAIENTMDFQGQSRRSRHRLTHLEMIDSADISRFSVLNVTADFQVAGSYTLPKHRKDFSELVGKAKALDTIPVRSVWGTGANVTLSSDWDVSAINPFLGIQHATQRQHQAVDVKTAVEMYTINGAYVMRQEGLVGSLVAGKDADMIVIDQDVFNIPPGRIGQTKVLQTFVKGKVVFSKSKV